MQMHRAMNPEAPSRPAGLPHAVFLQRVADEPATSPEVRLGQGAFLTLRFVDLLAPGREPPTPDVFRYQWAATERYCAELAGEGTEASHLSGIVRVTGEAHASGSIRLIGPALFAYALFLEQESHFEEAEDVLHTMISVGQERLAVSDKISAWMRIGRVRRLQTEFDGAEAAYAKAGEIAESTGDQQTVLFSRVGHSNVLYFRGNLAEAEVSWRAVLRDAQRFGFRRIESEAEHGLGNVLNRRGQIHEGIPHLWRAFELYEDASGQLRALGDLGLSLLVLGNADAAEQALQEVIRRADSGELVINAKIELMHCASFRRDRVSFERWRERAMQGFEQVPPNIRADYHLKAGIGFARFENKRRAEVELRHALEIALAHELHEMVFRIERLLAGLKDCGAPDYTESAESTSVIQTDSLREVSASLAALSG
jgi:tetratricopeptide (TPR) repeat protein